MKKTKLGHKKVRLHNLKKKIKKDWWRSSTVIWSGWESSRKTFESNLSLWRIRMWEIFQHKSVKVKRKLNNGPSNGYCKV